MTISNDTIREGWRPAIHAICPVCGHELALVGAGRYLAHACEGGCAVRFELRRFVRAGRKLLADLRLAAEGTRCRK